LRITITRRGFVIDYRGAHVSRFATGVGHVGPLLRFRDGVVRRIDLGADATGVRGSVTNSYLVVDRRLGSRTWTWHITTNLEPAIRSDGALLLSGADSFVVQPPRIFDRSGTDVTVYVHGPAHPGRLRWRIAPEGDGYRLSVRIVDRYLALPYVISG
jgi:hypothetical protein